MLDNEFCVFLEYEVSKRFANFRPKKNNNLRHMFKIVTFILLLTVTKSYGQTSVCDTVYSNSETMPKYDNEFKGFSDYLTKELVPIIGTCLKQDAAITTSLYIILTIDNNGKVIEATFPRCNLTPLCKVDLEKKLLTMTGWTAGKKDGQPICCKFSWPISCLKWER